MSDDRKTKKLPTSSLGRMARLGGLVGRVGTSIAADRAAGLLRSGPAKEARRARNLVTNAVRVVKTLGEMKGAAMKVGQMLSLHEGMLPAEVVAVLRQLQGSAPQVPPEVMRYEVEGSLGAPIGELFEGFEEEAFAAASIGQVHRARLPGGEPVAVKVQYPLIREVVEADLDNLRALFRALFSMVFDADFAPLWNEMRDRLSEELDYEHEAENMRRFAELHAGVPEVVIPRVIGERSTDRVLTMEMVEGIPPDEACSREQPAELRDRWGRALFELQVRGLFEHRLLHADPNLANFAFRADGRVVLYDFGCVKRVPEAIAAGYARLALAVLEGERGEVPEILRRIGFHRADGSPVERALLDPYLDLVAEIARPDPPYRFGEEEGLYGRILQLGMENWHQSTDLRFPEDVIFIDRSLGGHFGNLIRLGAAGPWRGIVERYARRALGDREPATT